MKKILFVCLGNICRSPLAEGIAEAYIKNQGLEIEVDSCGTGDYHKGEHPCPNSIKIAQQRGINIAAQISRPITKRDFEHFDMIIGLDESNIQNLIKMGAPKAKLSKLGSYGFNNEDVPDPYFFDGFEGFERVFEMIESCVYMLLNEKASSTL